MTCKPSCMDRHRLWRVLSASSTAGECPAMQRSGVNSRNGTVACHTSFVTSSTTVSPSTDTYTWRVLSHPAVCQASASPRTAPDTRMRRPFQCTRLPLGRSALERKHRLQRHRPARASECPPACVERRARANLTAGFERPLERAARYRASCQLEPERTAAISGMQDKRGQ